MIETTLKQIGLILLAAAIGYAATILATRFNDLTLAVEQTSSCHQGIELSLPETRGMK